MKNVSAINACELILIQVVLNLRAFFLVGCLPSYVSECGDRSDTFLCPASACQNKSQFFPCHDNKYCVMAHLVCDGYAQCQDESGRLNH